MITLCGFYNVYKRDINLRIHDTCTFLHFTVSVLSFMATDDVGAIMTVVHTKN